MVEGDTNTVLAGAVVAVKLGAKVGYVGLRSYDSGCIRKPAVRASVLLIRSVIFKNNMAAEVVHMASLPQKPISEMYIKNV